MIRLFALLMLFPGAVHAESFCAEHLRANTTKQLLAYFDALLHEGQLKTEDITSVRGEWRSGIIRNPFRSANTSDRIHARAIEQYLRSGEVDTELVISWIDRILEKQVAEKNVRQGRAQRTTSSATQMIFHRVEPAKFANRKLTYPIEVMSTLVTQKMWASTMTRIPSINLFGLSDEEAADLPIENITWLEAVRFANILSLSEGLEPVYDLHALSEWELSADMDNDNPPPVPILAPGGDIRKTNGYRLPTVEEAQFLLAPDRIPHAPEENYFWLEDNSNFRTHDVGSLLPISIDGHEYFDLFGNVEFWAGQLNDRVAWVAGVSYFYPKEDIGLHEPSVSRVTHREKNVGLRLVRTAR